MTSTFHSTATIRTGVTGSVHNTYFSCERGVGKGGQNREASLHRIAAAYCHSRGQRVSRSHPGSAAKRLNGRGICGDPWEKRTALGYLGTLSHVAGPCRRRGPAKSPAVARLVIRRMWRRVERRGQCEHNRQCLSSTLTASAPTPTPSSPLHPSGDGINPLQLEPRRCPSILHMHGHDGDGNEASARRTVHALAATCLNCGHSCHDTVTDAALSAGASQPPWYRPQPPPSSRPQPPPSSRPQPPSSGLTDAAVAVAAEQPGD